MKNIIQLLMLVLIFSCDNNKAANKQPADSNSTDKEILKKPIEIEFKPDSSYVKYWCSAEILKKTAESIDNLEVTTVAMFLATFHKDCASNVEYLEWSNELLFEVAKRSPDYLLQLLHKNSSLDKALIKDVFKSPIHDGIDLDEVIKKIEKSNSPTNIKNEIIESLKIAKSKY